MDDARINENYRRNLIREIGQLEFDKLESLSYLTVKRNALELQFMRFEFTIEAEREYKKRFNRDLNHSLCKRRDFNEYKSKKNG